LTNSQMYELFDALRPRATDHRTGTVSTCAPSRSIPRDRLCLNAPSVPFFSQLFRLELQFRTPVQLSPFAGLKLPPVGGIFLNQKQLNHNQELTSLAASASSNSPSSEYSILLGGLRGTAPIYLHLSNTFKYIYHSVESYEMNCIGIIKIKDYIITLEDSGNLDFSSLVLYNRDGYYIKALYLEDLLCRPNDSNSNFNFAPDSLSLLSD